MPGYEVIGAEELSEVQDVFLNGGVLFRHGFENLRNNCFKVQKFEQKFAEHMGCRYALAVSSGTAALRVALAALNIGVGDEVVTQCFTFVATVESIIEAGAVPVCAEIDSTLNLDPQDLIKRITPRTKAVIVVHMLGTPARMVEIKEICRKHNLALIEDTAWGCGGKLEGSPLGTWGDVGTFSFDFAKTMTTGEGGMILFHDESTLRKGAAWHDHGHENNPTLPRWEDTRKGSGFNYRMMELQGAVGLAQLIKLPAIVESQRKNLEDIWRKLSKLPSISRRSAPKNSYETADALVFFVEDSRVAIRCREELIKEGVATKILPEAYSWHFAGTWSHMPELVAAHAGELETAFPNSKTLLSRAVSIGIGVKMAADIPERVCRAIVRAISE
jgi:8-amino-3,8-dideoxy-alpha-D-manno-octulosonate transaminase